MAYTAVMLLLTAALAMAMAERWSDRLRAATLVPLLIAFVFLYLTVGDEVAQDRDQYYFWYRNVAYELGDPGSRDQFFSWLLSLLPDSLSKDFFALVLAGTVFLTLAVITRTLVSHHVMPWDHVPLVILAVISDRLFLDMALNVTRGSLAGLVFILGVFARGTGLRWLLWAVAFGIHGRLVPVLVLGYFLSRLLRSHRRTLNLFMGLGVLAFLVKIATGGLIIPQLAAVDWLMQLSESESVRRGLSISGELTFSLATQLLVAVLVPLSLLYMSRAGEVGARGPSPAPGQPATLGPTEIVALSGTTIAIGLLLYPELAMAQRVLIVPLVLLPCLLGRFALTTLVLVKLAIFAAVMTSHFRV